jgi:hypothetical protein
LGGFRHQVLPGLRPSLKDLLGTAKIENSAISSIRSPP